MLPHIEEIFEKLLGGAVYSKLDLPDAYHQVDFDEESKRHVVITTHKGLYRYNLLCFGIAFAPASIQGIIEQILQPIKREQLYLDDIALKGINDRDHLQVLQRTFSTLRQAGVKLKREKCLHAEVNRVFWTCSRRFRSSSKPRQSRGNSESFTTAEPRTTGNLSRHGAVLWATRPRAMHAYRLAQRTLKKGSCVQVEAQTAICFRKPEE